MTRKVKRKSRIRHSFVPKARLDSILVEHYRQGYPRLAAFLNIDQNFTVFKRFDSLHLRVLLEQQDRLCELQQQLEDCDDVETIQVNLSNRRQDSNLVRRDILRQVKAELELYGMQANNKPHARCFQS